jgi:hypothetical protein
MSETLEGMRWDEWELVINVTGGGVAERFPKGLDTKVVANRLRYLADCLDFSVEERERRASPNT